MKEAQDDTYRERRGGARLAVLALLLLPLCLPAPAVAQGGAPPATVPGERADARLGPVPEDFTLWYAYGACMDYTFDGGRGRFGRWIRGEAPVEVPVQLTPAEREAIYQEMLRIGFFSFPGEVTVDLRGAATVGTVVPFLRHQLGVRRNGAWQWVRWTEEITSPRTERMEDVRALGRTIRGVLESKPEVKGMPDPGVACL